MNRKLLSSALVLCLIFAIVSCSKDSSNDSGGGIEPTPLEKSADSLKKFVLGKHFVPVDFYASRPIDYDQTDQDMTKKTDLKPYILPYLADDVIEFRDNGVLHVDQGTILYSGKPTTFDTVWSVETSKALNAVYLNYLDYYYHGRRYTLSTRNDSTMIAYVAWVNPNDGADTATLYTKFLKK